MADIQAGIKQANEQLQQTQNTKSAHTRRTDRGARCGGQSRRRRPRRRLRRSAGRVRPADQGRRGPRPAAGHPGRRSRRTPSGSAAHSSRRLFTAESRVRGVSEYIDTRRGSIGPDARTRLAEANEHLQAAQDKRATNLTEAIAHANAASTLAAQAQSLANADVQSAQRAYSRRRGNDIGAHDRRDHHRRPAQRRHAGRVRRLEPHVVRRLARARSTAASWVAAGDSERPITNGPETAHAPGTRYPGVSRPCSRAGAPDTGAPPLEPIFVRPSWSRRRCRCWPCCCRRSAPSGRGSWPARRSPGSYDPTG